MLTEVKKTANEQMDKAISSLGIELGKVRTGRANVSMLDSVQVSYYGNMAPLSQVATLACPDARSFLITPWESNLLKEIEAGIVKSNVGMSPQNDGKAIRLRIPELTEERRKDMVKSIKKIIEDARIAVRMARRVANDNSKKLLKEKQISEDEQKQVTTEVQKMTDDFVKKIDQISIEKEKDLLTV